MKPTQFLMRSSILARMLDFSAHLKNNGLVSGLANVEQSLAVMPYLNLATPDELRLALKAIHCQGYDSFLRFDELFNSFWMNKGRERVKEKQIDQHRTRQNQRTTFALLEDHMDTNGSGAIDVPEDKNDEGMSAVSGEGRLIATRTINRDKVDFREYVRNEDKAEAEEAARRIALAIRYRRSRRMKVNLKGRSLDLRRMIRKSIARGGELIERLHKKPPTKPVHFVLLLDVSGSMQNYARIFLAFIKGMIGQGQTTDAYLFNTRLMRISDILRDKNTFRALNKLSVMAHGFGGGTRIGDCLNNFMAQYGARSLNSRSVVMIMSDGYDTGDSESVGQEICRMKKKGCRIIWLNPLLGWKNYKPVAKSMQEALPHLDRFAACNTLSSLANLEQEFCRI